MKTKFFTLIAICILCAGTSFAQWAEFPFDENVMDINENLQATASPAGLSFVEDAERGMVLEFDGEDGFITLGNSAYNHDAVSINVWFNWMVEEHVWWVRVFDFGEHIDNEPEDPRDVLFVTLFAWDAIQWNIHQGASMAPGTDSTLRTADPIELNTWHMLTTVHSANEAKLYLNAELVQAVTLEDVPPSSLTFVDLFIGKSNWPDALFQGRMDQLTIWDKALSEEEIAELFSPSSETFVRSEKRLDARIFAANGMIKVLLPETSSSASISVYNVLGSEVQRMVNVGSSTEFTGLQSGMYIVRVTDSANKVATQKVLIR